MSRPHDRMALRTGDGHRKGKGIQAGAVINIAGNVREFFNGHVGQFGGIAHALEVGFRVRGSPAQPRFEILGAGFVLPIEITSGDDKRNLLRFQALDDTHGRFRDDETGGEERFGVGAADHALRSGGCALDQMLAEQVLLKCLGG